MKVFESLDLDRDHMLNEEEQVRRLLTLPLLLLALLLPHVLTKEEQHAAEELFHGNDMS